ncbi:hypothetical protein N7537_004735 [Penicillium hordei]|uniref:Uncharacterized protein n=1 Tax=Penicillium hordei TaxID=40994 RepID=A0AAD6EBU2_9EURO|nr:uncharacterized protein N7537_004735 [Penicillium hordei]KAJ5608116.1 hypothetical protein N7537_004735 [Penicillium hordei]
MEALGTLNLGKPSHLAPYAYSVLCNTTPRLYSVSLDKYDQHPVLAASTSIPQEFKVNQESMHE